MRETINETIQKNHVLSSSCSSHRRALLYFPIWADAQTVPLPSWNDGSAKQSIVLFVERLYPSEAVVAFEGKESKAMADQLATVSKSRLFNRAGVLSEEDMRKVEEAVKIQLGIH